MSSEKKKNALGEMTTHTSRKAAFGQMLHILRALKAGHDLDGEVAGEEEILWLMMAASVGIKSIARAEYNHHGLTHAEGERTYVESVEEMVADMPVSPPERLKLDLMGVRSPSIIATEDMPLSDIQHGLYDIALTAEDAREDFILSDGASVLHLVMAVSRIAYNARSMLGMICETYGIDADELMQVADDMVHRDAEETGALDFLDDLKRKMEDEDGD